MAKKWMRDSPKTAYGMVSERAKAAGKPVAEFAAAHAHDKVNGKSARLALVGMGKSIPDRPPSVPREQKRYGKPAGSGGPDGMDTSKAKAEIASDNKTIGEV